MRTLLVLAVLAACSKPTQEDYAKSAGPAPEQPKVDKPPPPPPPKPKKLTEQDLGTCHVTASGAVTADVTSPGGRTTTNVSYWYNEAERKTMMGIDGFVVSCVGKDMRFQIVPGSSGKKDAMPFKPKTYTFDRGKGEASVMAVFGKQSLTNASGTVDVTAFDSHHIAGTIDIKGKVVPGNGDVKIEGKFDYVCPGVSACDK